MPARFLFLRGWKARREAKSLIAEGHFVACPTCCVSNGSQGRLGSAGSCAYPDRRHGLNRGCGCVRCMAGGTRSALPTTPPQVVGGRWDQSGSLFVPVTLPLPDSDSLRPVSLFALSFSFSARSLRDETMLAIAVVEPMFATLCSSPRPSCVV